MNCEKLDSDMTIGEALAWAARSLRSSGIHPAEREARWLLEHTLGKDRAKVLTDLGTSLTRTQQEHYVRLVQRRVERYPLQYLLAEVDFAGVTLDVTPDVLIPRPETEQLVERVLQLVADRNAALQCADLGTGSGCIAIALAAQLPQSRWRACDTSAAALAIARQNAERNGVAERITFSRGRWFDAFPPEMRFDVIVTNPPYVADGEKLEPELRHEPRCALFAGREGLDAYTEILPELRTHLAPAGIFVGEIGHEQTGALRALARQHGFADAEFTRDLSGRTRFFVIRFQEREE